MPLLCLPEHGAILHLIYFAHLFDLLLYTLAAWSRILVALASMMTALTIMAQTATSKVVIIRDVIIIPIMIPIEVGVIQREAVIRVIVVAHASLEKDFRMYYQNENCCACDYLCVAYKLLIARCVPIYKRAFALWSPLVLRLRSTGLPCVPPIAFGIAIAVPVIDGLFRDLRLPSRLGSRTIALRTDAVILVEFGGVAHASPTL